MKYLEANEIVFRHIDRDGVDFDGLIEDIRAAVAEAVAAERERNCKAVCEHCANDWTLEWLNGALWHVGPEPYKHTTPCKAIAIRVRGGGE